MSWSHPGPTRTLGMPSPAGVRACGGQGLRRKGDGPRNRGESTAGLEWVGCLNQIWQVPSQKAGLENLGLA